MSEPIKIISKVNLDDGTEIRVCTDGSVFHGDNRVYEPEIKPKRCMSQLPVDTLVAVWDYGSSTKTRYTSGTEGECFERGATSRAGGRLWDLVNWKNFKVLEQPTFSIHDGSDEPPVPEWVTVEVLIGSNCFNRPVGEVYWPNVKLYRITGEVE